ncbi:hypothetical protein [Plantactinospora sp. DSM 117369]
MLKPVASAGTDNVVSCASAVDLLALSLTDPRAFATLDDIAYRIIERPRHVSLINPYAWGRVPPDDALAEIRALPSYAHDCWRSRLDTRSHGRSTW